MCLGVALSEVAGCCFVVVRLDLVPVYDWMDFCVGLLDLVSWGGFTTPLCFAVLW